MCSERLSLPLGCACSAGLCPTKRLTGRTSLSKHLTYTVSFSVLEASVAPSIMTEMYRASF